jgi:hypothetical protein
MVADHQGSGNKGGISNAANRRRYIRPRCRLGARPPRAANEMRDVRPEGRDLERFPLSVNRGDSLRATNKIL